VAEGYWDNEKGWVGAPLRWRNRSFWCKLGLHRWGAPWCMECGYPDKILQSCIKKVFENLKNKSKSEEAEDGKSI